MAHRTRNRPIGRVAGLVAAMFCAAALSTSDAAVITVLKATGIRAGELAGIRYDPHDPRRSDLDLQGREITVRGKGGRPRVVRIGHEAARALDRYIRVRARASGKPVALHVPPGICEHLVAGRGQAHRVGCLGAGHEPERHVTGEPQKLNEPGPRDLLDHGGHRRRQVVVRRLVPAHGQHVGCGRGRRGHPR